MKKSELEALLREAARVSRDRLVAWRDKDQIFLKGMLRHKFAKPAIVRQRIGDLPIGEIQKHDLCVALDQLIANCRAKQTKKRSRK